VEDTHLRWYRRFLSFSLTALSFPREIEVLAGLIRHSRCVPSLHGAGLSPDMSQTVVSDCAAELAAGLKSSICRTLHPEVSSGYRHIEMTSHFPEAFPAELSGMCTALAGWRAPAFTC
jgi:hypothetical protein